MYGLVFTVQGLGFRVMGRVMPGSRKSTMISRGDPPKPSQQVLVLGFPSCTQEESNNSSKLLTPPDPEPWTFHPNSQTLILQLPNPRRAAGCFSLVPTELARDMDQAGSAALRVEGLGFRV